MNSEEIGNATQILKSGGLVAVPTETVYGLAADATNDHAVARIFEAKGRPTFNPLIAHVTGIAMAGQHVDFSPLAQTLAHAFWPGALTLVLPRKARSEISHLATAGLDTVAVRAPDHAVTQALLDTFGRPVVAPSANRSGSISPTTAAHVAGGLGEQVDGIIDGGPCRIGLESTIVKIDGDKAQLLRPGGITRSEIEQIAGKLLIAPRDQAILAPGMLSSHYAPGAKVRLNIRTPMTTEAFLAFGPAENSAKTNNLSVSGDLTEAAANLFSHLRALDKICADLGLDGIAVAPIPEIGLGEAINDRLRRAAAPAD